jgi:hypothetical protein
MDIVDDVYVYLFSLIDKIEYQSLSCTCKQLESIAIKNRSLLTPSNDALTCVVQDYHLTSYQTYVLRLLLSRINFRASGEFIPSGVDKYQVPDLYNLRRIKAAYCSITRRMFIVSHKERSHIQQALEDYPFLLSSVKFETGNDDQILVLGHDSCQLYMDQQRYPVWVSSKFIDSIDNLPDGRVLELSHKNNGIFQQEDIVSPFAPIEKYSDFDIFAESSNDFRFTRSIFSTLTQIRSKRPKVFITTLGVISSPAKHIEESLSRLQLINPKSNYTPRKWNNCMVANPTPAKLFISNYYSTEGNEELDLVQAVVNDFIGENCFIFSQEFNTSMGKQEIKLTMDGDTKNTWVLIDPCAQLNDPLLTSVDTGMPRSQDRIASNELRKKLLKLLASPTLRKGMMTKDEVFQECVKRGVPCKKTENRPVLAKRLLESL